MAKKNQPCVGPLKWEIGGESDKMLLMLSWIRIWNRRLVLPAKHANRNIPVHELLLVSPTRSEERTKDYFLADHISGISERGYPAAILRKYLSEVKFANKKTALPRRNKSARKKLLPFVTQCNPALPNLKKILMGNDTLYKAKGLRKIFKEPLLISCHRGKSLNS